LRDHASTRPSGSQHRLLNPSADKTFSRRSSSCFCKSWVSPSTSTTSADLSKTPCDLYGVTVKIDNKSRNTCMIYKPNHTQVQV
jgi:hypothetical protein